MNRAGHAGSLVLTILGSALFDDVTFFLNTSIPMLLSYRLSSNDTLITFFGEKDAAGKTASVTGVATQTSDGRRADVVMDTIGRPSRVILPDGSQLKFSWQSNGIGVLSVLAPNGLLVEGVAINLGSSAIAKANLTVTQMSLDQQASGPVNATAYISVTSNGQPVSDAIVYANVIPRNLGIDHPGYTLQAGEVSPGVYAVGFVNSSSDLLPASAVDAACN